MTNEEAIQAMQEAIIEFDKQKVLTKERFCMMACPACNNGVLFKLDKPVCPNCGTEFTINNEAKP